MDFPFQGVHAVLPVKARQAGNSQVFTIPRQFQDHELLLVVLEQHKNTDKTTKAPPVPQSDRKQTQSITKEQPKPRPQPPRTTTTQPTPIAQKNTQPPPRNTQTPPTTQTHTKEDNPYTAPCGKPHLTPQGLKTHLQECLTDACGDHSSREKKP